MARKLLVLIVMGVVACAASAAWAGAASLQGKNIKVICGYGDRYNLQGWSTRYYRNPADLTPVFEEILDELGANKMAPGSPLYKGSYIMRVTAETHEGATEYNQLDVGRGNRTNGWRKPVTASVKITIRQIVDSKGTTGPALISSTGTANTSSGFNRTDLSIGRFQGRPFRTSNETRVSPQEAEYAALSAALQEAASGLTRPIPVYKPKKAERSYEDENCEDENPKANSRSKREAEKDPYKLYHKSQPKTEKQHEDILVSPQPQPSAEKEEEDILVAPVPKD